MRRGFFSARCAGLTGQQVMRSVSHDAGDSFKFSRCHVKDLLEHSRSINHCNTRRKTTVPKENHIHRGIQRYRFASRNWEPIQQATDAMLFLFSKRNSNICMIKKKTDRMQECDCRMSIMNKCWDKDEEKILRAPIRKTIIKTQAALSFMDLSRHSRSQTNSVAEAGAFFNTSSKNHCLCDVVSSHRHPLLTHELNYQSVEITWHSQAMFMPFKKQTTSNLKNKYGQRSCFKVYYKQLSVC